MSAPKPLGRSITVTLFLRDVPYSMPSHEVAAAIYEVVKTVEGDAFTVRDYIWEREYSE